VNHVLVIVALVFVIASIGAAVSRPKDQGRDRWRPRTTADTPGSEETTVSASGDDHGRK
jgi:hypothetical protein